MEGPLVDIVGIAALIAIVGISILMLLRRRPRGAARPERDLAWEWVAQPADRADHEFRARFADDFVHGPDATLLRVAFFNGGLEDITPMQVVRPLSLTFGGGTEILRAEFAEALKSAATGAPEPVIGPARIEFPPFAIAPAGVVVFNIAVRGNARPIGLEGAIEGIERIRRLG